MFQRLARADVADEGLAIKPPVDVDDAPADLHRKVAAVLAAVHRFEDHALPA